MALNILQRLYGVVTQGGADAFAIASIATGLAGLNNVGYRVRGIEFDLPSVATPNGNNVEVALLRKTRAAMPLITDPALIKKFKRSAYLATSGLAFNDNIIYWKGEGDVIVVEDYLYLAIDANATTLTQSAYCAIDVETVKVSELEKLELLNRYIGS